MSGHRADAAQGTWLRLFEKFRTIRDPERLGAWLMTTARRECLALIAHGQRERATDTAGWAEQASPDPTPETDALAADERETLRRAAAELSSRHALLLDALFGTEPSTYAEIASRLGIPVGSIGPTRARIMLRLRQLLRDLDA